MARVRGVATIAEQALGAGAAETILQIVAAANDKVAATAWGVHFDGTSPTAEPVVVQLLFQTGAGTSAANTPVKLDQSDGTTLQTTARDSFTVEPTDGNVVRRIEVHPQGGYVERFPLFQEPDVQNTGRLAIKCTAPAAVNATGWIEFEE